MVASERGEAHLAYWQKQLAGTPPVLRLFHDAPKNVSGLERRIHIARLSPALSADMRAFAASEGLNLATVFLGIFKLLLYQLSGEDELWVGMPVMVRPRRCFQNTLGYFVNMMVVRSCFQKEPSFIDFLKALRLTMTDGLDHSVYPFALLAQKLRFNLKNAAAKEAPSLYQAIFAFQNFTRPLAPAGEGLDTGLTVAHLAHIHQEGDEPLGLEVFEQADHFQLIMTHDSALLGESFV